MYQPESRWKGFYDVLVSEYVYPEPIRSVSGTSYSCWDFTMTEYHKWLEKYAVYDWDWDLFGSEDEWNRIPCRVSFSDLNDLMAFKLAWAE